MKKTALLLTVCAVFAFLVKEPLKPANEYGNFSWGGDRIEEAREGMQKIVRKAGVADLAEELLGIFEDFRGRLIEFFEGFGGYSIEGIEIGEILEDLRKKGYLDGLESALDFVEEATGSTGDGHFEKAEE